jgi:hypothetical protein
VKNASLLGARNDASKTLAEEMRVDELNVVSVSGSDQTRGSNETNGHALNATAALYGSSKLWFAVKKHNAVVWGRALAACEAAEKTRKAVADATSDEKKKMSTLKEPNDDDDAFASFYQKSVVDAHADDLDALRVSGAKHDRSVSDVGVLLRAIQSGADVVPALQKALAVQFASLRAFAEGKRTVTGDLPGGSGLDSLSEGDEESEESDKEESDGSERSLSGGSASAGDSDEGNSDDASDDASSSESASAGGDDEVDYAVTPVAH